MASHSVLSDILFVVALLIICLVVLLVIRYYLPLRTTPSYLTTTVFLALALPASIVLLVPVDLASSTGEDEGELRGLWLPERVILVLWRIAYWLTFVLTWAFLPLIGEYTDSGYREPNAKLLYSLQSNGRYWAIMLIASIAGGAYFFVQEGFDFESVKGLVVALAYAWGLTLAIFLLGHGLVALPRRLFREASISNRLRIIQSHAPGVHERLIDATDNLDLYEDQVLQLRQKRAQTSKELQDWIDELAENSSLPESRGASIPGLTRTTVPPVITERYMAEITRKLKRARHKKVRFTDAWDRIVRKALNTQAILDSKTTKKLEFPRPDPFQPFGRFTLLTAFSRYVLHVHVVPIVYYLLSAILSIVGVVIVWSSIVKASAQKLSIIGLSVVHHPSSSGGKIGLAGQLIASFWILYMCAAALYSVTEVKIWGNRALVRRGTYPESAAWYACQVAKLTVPLSYNFITFLPYNIYSNTKFHQFIGKLINLTPLSAYFKDYFPILILLPIFATMFGLYKKVKNVFGNFAGDVMDDEAEGTDEDGQTSRWREGRLLIEREAQISSNALANGSTSLGMPSRNNIDVQSSRPEHYTDDESSTSYASHTPSHSNGSTTAPQSRLERATRQARIQEEEDGGGFFEDLGSRLRNTFEGIERPKWMGGSESTSGSPEREPWFARNPFADSGSGSNAEGEGAGNSLRRWFGGGASEGRVRL